MTLEEKVALGQNIQTIDTQLNNQSAEFERANSVVKQCGKKFNEFNVKDKYQQREEELKEG